MDLKKSPLLTQGEIERDIDSAIDYPTIADLMREQKIASHEANTVHHRRDLDSLG